MYTLLRFLIPVMMFFFVEFVRGQEDYKKRVEALRVLREQVEAIEKEGLKDDIRQIEDRYRAGKISIEEAQTSKEEAAKMRALNIQDRFEMIDREIALLERNRGEVLKIMGHPEKGNRSLGIQIRVDDEPLVLWPVAEPGTPRDRRTYSDMVFAFGFNNALKSGQSLEDTDFKLAGSRFFEIGWAWRTRVFQNTNWLRLHYGLSFQFNGLEFKDNQSFSIDNGQTRIQPFALELDKSKFRMDNLVFPVHLEIGPSSLKEYDDHFRYSLHNKFRLGFGGYAGFNMGSRQKLKYVLDGNRVKEKLKSGYNTSELIYGISGYLGVEGVLLYAKYDLNPIFQNTAEDQRNISLGLRFDL